MSNTTNITLNTENGQIETIEGVEYKIQNAENVASRIIELMGRIAACRNVAYSNKGDRGTFSRYMEESSFFEIQLEGILRTLSDVMKWDKFTLEARYVLEKLCFKCMGVSKAVREEIVTGYTWRILDLLKKNPENARETKKTE